MASHFLFINMKEEKKITKILSKVERYCSYQERCKSEVEKKLVDLGVTEKMKKSILYELSKKKYFDNTRFSYEYAIGKLRNNKWGKFKISYHLRSKSIEKSLIDKGHDISVENKLISGYGPISIIYKNSNKEFIGVPDIRVGTEKAFNNS